MEAGGADGRRSGRSHRAVRWRPACRPPLARVGGFRPKLPLPPLPPIAQVQSTARSGEIAGAQILPHESGRCHSGCFSSVRCSGNSFSTDLGRIFNLVLNLKGPGCRGWASAGAGLVDTLSAHLSPTPDVRKANSVRQQGGSDESPESRGASHFLSLAIQPRGMRTLGCN